MYAATTHASLLARLADRTDAVAWREFLERYGDLLRGFARRHGLAPDESEDVVQDVVAALIPSMTTFRYDPERGRFRGFLKTIAVRAIAKRVCQNAKAKPLLDLEESATSDREAARTEEQWELEWRQYHMRQAMRTIEVEFSARDRSAFQRYAVQGESVQEAAEAVGMSVDHVYQAKSRIMRRLSELISAQLADEG